MFFILEGYLSVKLNFDEFACAGFRAGGDDGIRTHDPLLAGQVLSQLSYTPMVYVPLPLFCEPEAPSKLNNNLN